MSRVYTDTLEPRKPTQDITLGTTGETISVGANSINVNTVKDKGGNTLWTSDGSGVLSSIGAGLQGNLKLLATQTGSGVATIDFTTGIDSTYDVYIFKWFNVNPATDLAHFAFQANAVGASGFNEVMTTTYFVAYHHESNSGTGLIYHASYDQAQGTAYQPFNDQGGNAADESCAGELYLFNPSQTTYVKHFYSTTQTYQGADYSTNAYVCGYFNITAAIDEVSFKMTSGNMDGIIKMYGLL